MRSSPDPADSGRETTDAPARRRTVPDALEARARLAECAAALAEAERELGAALVAGDRARVNRARLAVDRLRQRQAWLAPRAAQG